MRQLPGKRIQEKCPRSEDKLGLHILSKRIILRLVKIRRYSKMAQITKDTMINYLHVILIFIMADFTFYI